MKQDLPLREAINLLLALLLIAISGYVLFFLQASSAEAQRDLELCAALIGAYGIWKIIRTSLMWRKR